VAVVEVVGVVVVPQAALAVLVAAALAVVEQAANGSRLIMNKTNFRIDTNKKTCDVHKFFSVLLIM
jgi:hypothetical protein